MQKDDLNNMVEHTAKQKVGWTEGLNGSYGITYLLKWEDEKADVFYFAPYTEEEEDCSYRVGREGCKDENERIQILKLCRL